jgi:hypothetical protein
MSPPLLPYRCPGCHRVQRLAAHATQKRAWCPVCQRSTLWYRLACALTALEPWPPPPRRVLHVVEYSPQGKSGK